MSSGDADLYTSAKVRPAGVPAFNKNDKGEVIVPVGEPFCRVDIGGGSVQLCACNGRYSGTARSVRDHIKKKHKDVKCEKGTGGRGTTENKNFAAVEFAAAYAAHRAHQTSTITSHNAYSTAVAGVTTYDAGPSSTPARKRQKSVDLTDESDDESDTEKRKSRKRNGKKRSSAAKTMNDGAATDGGRKKRPRRSMAAKLSEQKVTEDDEDEDADLPRPTVGGKTLLTDDGNPEPVVSTKLSTPPGKTKYVLQGDGSKIRKIEKNEADMPFIPADFIPIVKDSAEWNMLLLAKPDKSGNRISIKKLRKHVGVTADQCRECRNTKRKCPDIAALDWSESSCLALKGYQLPKESEDEDEDLLGIQVPTVSEDQFDKIEQGSEVWKEKCQVQGPEGGRVDSRIEIRNLVGVTAQRCLACATDSRTACPDLAAEDWEKSSCLVLKFFVQQEDES